jgi:hypothetical protein
LGRLPEEGATVSQFPPLLVTGVVVNEVIAALLLETVTSWVTGTVLLAAKTKLKEFGLAEIGLIPPVELGLNTTGTERKDPAELILMNPTSVAVGAAEPIDTDSTIGVVPLVGVTCSHFVSEKADTVIACVVPDVTCSSCVTPGPLNRSCGGLAVGALFCALAVPIRHTSADIRTTRRNKYVCVVFTIFSKPAESCGVERGRGNRRLEQASCHGI